MPIYSQTFVCDEHASEKLQTFYRDQLNIDIVLASKMDNLMVHAHSEVLYASCEEFLAMRCKKLKESRYDGIELEIDGATLKVVVDFMYSGTIELLGENVMRILEAADIIHLYKLKNACLNFIEKTMDATIWLTIVSMPNKQKSAELHKKAFEFALQNFEELYKKAEFMQLTEEQLSELISSDELCVNSEETVFHSVVSWVKYDKGSREESMIGLLSHVRFSFLTPEFIFDNRQSVSKTYECLELVFSWLESIMSKTTLTKCHSPRRKANRKERDLIGFLSGQYLHDMKLQFFDPESNIWIYENVPLAPMAMDCYSSIVVEETLITVGGMRGSYEYSDRIESLNLKTKKWTILPPMRQKRRHPGLAVTRGNLYVIGGVGMLGCLRSVEKYNFCAREWSELAPLHSANGEIMVTDLGSVLYAVGRGSELPIESFGIYDGEWTQLPHKNEKSIHYGIVGVGVYLYAVGGMLNGVTRKTVERYSDSLRRWQVINSDLGPSLSSLNCISWKLTPSLGRIVCCYFCPHTNSESSVLEYKIEDNEWTTLAAVVKHENNCFLFEFKHL